MEISKLSGRDFPGGHVVRMLGFHCYGSIPGWRTEIMQAVWHGKKKKKKKNTTKFNYTGSYIKDKVKKNYLGWEFSSSPVVRVLGLILGWGISHVM